MLLIWPARSKEERENFLFRKRIDFVETHESLHENLQLSKRNLVIIGLADLEGARPPMGDLQGSALSLRLLQESRFH